MHTDIYKQNILVACHDTGGANALSTLVNYLNKVGFNILVISARYASDVFKKAGIIPYEIFDQEPGKQKIDDLFNELQPIAVLTGTSFDSWVERWFCLKARKEGVFCLSFVDWWSNFGNRFSTPYTNDLAYLPNAIAVSDEDAYRGCINEEIPKELLFITGNPYWDLLKDTSPEVNHKMSKKIRAKLGIPNNKTIGLLISSNIRKLDLNLGYDEIDFFKAITPLPDLTSKGEKIIWALKPHPKESVQELSQIINNLGLNLIILNGISGIESVLCSNFVIGMCSSLLFEAVLLGKKIISLQPNLNQEKLRFLKIFDRLGSPQIFDTQVASSLIKKLTNNDIPSPDINKISFPIGGNSSSKKIVDLITNSSALAL